MSIEWDSVNTYGLKEVEAEDLIIDDIAGGIGMLEMGVAGLIQTSVDWLISNGDLDKDDAYNERIVVHRCNSRKEMESTVLGSRISKMMSAKELSQYNRTLENILSERDYFRNYFMFAYMKPSKKMPGINLEKTANRLIRDITAIGRFVELYSGNTIVSDDSNENKPKNITKKNEKLSDEELIQLIKDIVINKAPEGGSISRSSLGLQLRKNGVDPKEYAENLTELILRLNLPLYIEGRSIR